MSLAFEAMEFALDAHKDQVRKYTGEPYWVHLAEVAGIVSTISWRVPDANPGLLVAVAWLHDVVEDCGVGPYELTERFGGDVRDGVLLLSDMEEGNRAARKAAARERLARAPWWVQTIKVADLMSNTASILLHDAAFAPVYRGEALALLDVMTAADERLVAMLRARLEPSYTQI